jgi:GMP reductase
MKTFDYDDIQLVPNKCVIKSRKEADTSVKFGPHTFKIPCCTCKYGERHR